MGCNIFGTSKERARRRAQDPRKPRKTLRLQSVKDASMHLGTRSVQVGLATIGPTRRPHRCGASRRARAPQCTAAVESLCRHCLSLLALTRDRRLTLSVDCRRCWLPAHLRPDAMHISGPHLVAPRLSRADEPPNLLYHAECVWFPVWDKTRRDRRHAPLHVPCFLTTHSLTLCPYSVHIWLYMIIHI